MQSDDMCGSPAADFVYDPPPYLHSTQLTGLVCPFSSCLHLHARPHYSACPHTHPECVNGSVLVESQPPGLIFVYAFPLHSVCGNTMEPPVQQLTAVEVTRTITAVHTCYLMTTHDFGSSSQSGSWIPRKSARAHLLGSTFSHIH